MPALTDERATPERVGFRRRLGLAAGVKVYAGGLAALTAAGFVTPGATATTLKGLGRFEETVDNSAGAAGDVLVDVSAGIFRFNNSAAGDAITDADIGANCYIVDDQTVAKTSGGNTRSTAGTVFDVDAAGVWVRFS